MIKCPKCNEIMEYASTKGTKTNYVCSHCNIPYERHTLRNEQGLIKYDELFELNNDGIIIRKW